MEIQLFELENLTCEYCFDSVRGKFLYRFKWKRLSDTNLQWIGIYLLDAKNQPKDLWFRPAAECLEGTSIVAPMVSGEQMYVANFAVFSGIGDTDTAVINQLIRELEWENVNCKAFYASGTIQWRLNKDSRHGTYTLTLDCSIRLKEGVVFSCYELGDTTIRIPIPGNIEKGHNKYLPFYLPDGAREFRIVSNAANMTVKKQSHRRFLKFFL